LLDIYKQIIDEDMNNDDDMGLGSYIIQKSMNDKSVESEKKECKC